MRTKTIAWSGRSASSTRASVSFLSACLVSTKNCSTVSIVSVADLTLTVTGSYRWRWASARISAGIVALNSAVWRPFGVSERIFSTSSRKPRSSISSASSSTM